MISEEEKQELSKLITSLASCRVLNREEKKAEKKAEKKVFFLLPGSFTGKEAICI